MIQQPRMKRKRVIIRRKNNKSNAAKKNVVKKMNYENLLESAIIYEKIDLLNEIFKQNNVDLEKRDQDGNTFLNLASRGGNLNIMRTLILNGAILDTQNNSGNTPLHHTYTFKYNNCMDLLISNGADQSIRNKLGKTAWEGI